MALRCTLNPPSIEIGVKCCRSPVEFEFAGRLVFAVVMKRVVFSSMFDPISVWQVVDIQC